MAILLFEGWDLHVAAYSSTVTVGIWDHQGFPNWTHGSRDAHTYVAGYTAGRALEPYEPLQITNTTSAGSSPIYRMSWWGRWDRNVGSPASNLMLCFVEQGSDTARVGLRVATDGRTATLATFSGSADFTGTPIGSGSASFGTTWAHYELYVNATLDIVELWQNGSKVAEATGALLSAANCTRFGFKAPGFTSNNSSRIHWDHMVLSDGATLRGTTGYHAAAVTYSVGTKDTTTGPRVRGRIKIGATDYLATPRLPFLHAANDLYAPRGMNVYYDYWMLDPSTSAAWGADLGITEWGLCRTDSTAGIVFFANAALTYVEMVSGFPEVKWEPPGVNILLDGPWVRTHPSVAWHEHVNNYPRLNPPYNYALAGDGMPGDDAPSPFDSADWGGLAYDDLFFEDYIGITAPGCITFTYPEEEVPDLPVGLTGLTFAQEYQTSYKDWETLFSGGDDFCSYFISGYKIHGEGNKKFQSNYLTVNYETDSLASAYIQGIWDYSLGSPADDPHARSNTGRWGSTQQIYGPRNDENFKHAFAKLKIRGHGKALQLKVKCQSGKPFWLNGWVMYVTGNSTT